MMDWALGLIGTLLYPLFSVIFVFIDGIQGIFFALAGVDTIYFGSANNWGHGQEITAGNTGAETDTGIIYYLFQNSLVKNMLLSIMLLAFFLIIIFTVMAFIKNAYVAKPKGWKDIIGSSIKGMANFFLLPVCCLLGVWLGNILLQAINGATSGGGTTQMDRKLFIACAYNANEFRNNPDEIADDDKVENLKKWAGRQTLIGSDEKFDTSTIVLGQPNSYYANIVDQVFANTHCSIYDQITVERWYALFEINYLILIVGGIFMLYVLCSLAFAMVRRMFMLVILFIISPGVCAMYPLDDGKVVGSWKDKFIKEFLSVYGAVAGMNIFFSIMPLIDKLHFSKAGFILMDDILQIFILVVGLLCVKDVIGLVSGFVGGDDAYGKGTSLMKSTLDTTKKYATKATGGAFRYVGKGMAASGDVKDKGWKGFVGKTAAFNNTLFKTGAKDLASFASKNIGATDAFDAVFDGYEKGQGEYKKNKGLREFQRDIKAFNKMAPDADFQIEKLRAKATELGIIDDVDKKLAKNYKMSLEDYRSNLKLTKDYSSKEKTFNTADTDYNSFMKALEDVKTGSMTTDVFRDKYGIDLGKAISRGVTIQNVIDQINGGLKSSAESMDIDKIVKDGRGRISRDQAIKIAESKRIINDAIDLRISKDNILSEAGQALIDAAKELKKSFKEGSDATAKTFTGNAVTKIEEAVEKVLLTKNDLSGRVNVGDIKATMDPVAITAITNSVDKLSNEGEKSAEEMQKMTEKLMHVLPSELEKAVKKASEKKK